MNEHPPRFVTQSEDRASRLHWYSHRLAIVEREELEAYREAQTTLLDALNAMKVLDTAIETNSIKTRRDIASAFTTAKYEATNGIG